MNIQNIDRPVLAIAEKHNISIEEANERINSSSVSLVAGDEIKTSPTMQISFLTTLNISLRVFKGEVGYQIPDGIPNLLSFKAETFNKLVENYGGMKKPPQHNNIKILFGQECFDSNCIEAISDGWRGGVNFYNQNRIVLDDSRSNLSLGAVLGSSIATFYAFCKYFELIDNIQQVNTGLSLWNLNAGLNWHKDTNQGPELVNLPKNIWILGLGHLGQAYIWTIGLMPYKNPTECLFLLQDADIVGIENIGSQVLCSNKHIGRPKARVCADFLENIKFKTQIIEKPYIEGDSNQFWMENFPFLLNGVDNIEARKGISNENIRFYLDGATNGMFSLFDSFTMKNVFHISESMEDIWKQTDTENHILNKNLYDRYEKEHGCGVIGNLGISTPFVGMFGSAIITSELVKAMNGGIRNTIFSAQMRDLTNFSVVEDGFYGQQFLRWAN